MFGVHGDRRLLFPNKSGTQRIVLELKIRRDARQTTIDKALPQITGYMDKCGAKEGHLVIFDQTKAAWEEKIFHDQTTHEGFQIELWGM